MVRDIDLHLGKRVRYRRRLLSLTQAQLADVVGVRFQQIQKYECGDNRISAATIWKLAVALEVSVGYFYEGLGTSDTPSARDELLASRETRDLIQAYYDLGEQPRRRLLDLAKSLSGDNKDA
jgi:transcriptional regulator with XRE-family HTH domain